ncbi:MAG: 30S ribosomal protein S13 [Candidatus Diapherotrites archaeon]|nr:30S ribosomal protein S13 [Candidatus Diapherotrites archaeon]
MAKEEQAKPKADNEPKAGKASKAAKTEAEIRHIVRIAGNDLDGNLPMPLALAGVKGVGNNLASAISKEAQKELGIDHRTKIGLLDEKQAEKVQDIVINPEKHGIPAWMLNRRHDIDDGKNKHLTGPELDIVHRGDISLMKKAKSYKGVRHQLGLTVRGQRTRTSGRKGTTVGVQRRKDSKGSGK